MKNSLPKSQVRAGSRESLREILRCQTRLLNPTPIQGQNVKRKKYVASWSEPQLVLKCFPRGRNLCVGINLDIDVPKLREQLGCYGNYVLRGIGRVFSLPSLFSARRSQVL